LAEGEKRKSLGEWGHDFSYFWGSVSLYLWDYLGLWPFIIHGPHIFFFFLFFFFSYALGPHILNLAPPIFLGFAKPTFSHPISHK
jgi:hypothetical protein